MLTIHSDQLRSTVTDAIAVVGGQLATREGDSIWTNGDDQVLIQPDTNSIRFSRPLNDPPIREKSLPEIASTLHGWLGTNIQLPAGHRIVVDENAGAAQQAILPMDADTDLEPSAIVAVLRGFTGSCDPSSTIKPTPTRERIESWTTEANVRLNRSPGDKDPEDAEPDYSIKLRGFEPAHLTMNGQATLQIDACPLLEAVTSTNSDAASRAACALLAMGATATTQFIRPELTHDALRYRATFVGTENTLPPAPWLARSVQEITTALRRSRTEMEALCEDPHIAARYLAIRKITPKS